MTALAKHFQAKGAAAVKQLGRKEKSGRWENPSQSGTVRINQN